MSDRVLSGKDFLTDDELDEMISCYETKENFDTMENERENFNNRFTDDDEEYLENLYSGSKK